MTYRRRVHTDIRTERVEGPTAVKDNTVTAPPENRHTRVPHTSDTF
ncbi:hypothetical protein ABTX62_36635 [Streptomyces sp. NPDC096046]